MNARNVGRPPRGGASRGRAPAAVPPSAGAGSGAAAGESPPAGRGRGAVPRPAGLGGGAPQSPDASERPYAAPWLLQGQVLLHNGWWLLGGRARTSVVRGRTRSPSARPPVFSLGFSCDAATAATERCPTELLCLTLGSQSVRCGVG